MLESKYTATGIEFDMMVILDDFKRTTKTILAVVAGIPIYKAAFIAKKSRKKSNPEDTYLWFNDRAFIKKKDNSLSNVWRHAQAKWEIYRNSNKELSLK